MAGLNGAVGDRIHRLQAGDDFARCEDLDVELAAGDFLDVFRHGLRAAVNRVERFGEGRGHAPVDGGQILRERGGGNGCGCRSGGATERAFANE